jgi:hypothetical protein
VKQLSDYDCPASHLVVKGKYAISQYRKRGSSVDGKLDARSRARHYHTLSLEELIFDDSLLQEEAISAPQGPSRPTEEEACINILFASLRDSLSAEEDQVLTLRLMDIPWQRVGEMLGQGASEIAKMRKRIATTVWMVWSLPIAEQEHSQDEKRAYSQTPPIPHELPANLVAVLTDQERQALTAYQQGASQESCPTVRSFPTYRVSPAGLCLGELPEATLGYFSQDHSHHEARPPGEIGGPVSKPASRRACHLRGTARSFF